MPETFSGVLNNSLMFYGDWMNGVVIPKGQTDRHNLLLYTYIYRCLRVKKNCAMKKIRFLVHFP